MVAALHWNKSGMLAAGVQKLAAFQLNKTCHAGSSIPPSGVQKSEKWSSNQVQKLFPS